MSNQEVQVVDRSDNFCRLSIIGMPNAYAFFGDEVFRIFPASIAGRLGQPLKCYVKLSDGPASEFAYIINRIDTMKSKNFLGMCDDKQKQWFLELQAKTIAISEKQFPELKENNHD